MVLMRVGIEKEVWEEGLKSDVLMEDEEMMRKIEIGKNIEKRKDWRRSGDMDEGKKDIENMRRIEIIRIGLMKKKKVISKRKGEKNKKKIMKSSRKGVLKNIIKKLEEMEKEKIVKKRINERKVERIEDGEIVESKEIELKSIEKSEKEKGSVEGLIGKEVERELIKILKGWKLSKIEIKNGLEWINILVDEEISDKGKIVVERIGRVLWKREEENKKDVESVEKIGEIIGENGDEEGRKEELRNERGIWLFRKLIEKESDGKILGKVEIVKERIWGRLRDKSGKVEGGRNKKGKIEGKRGLKRIRILNIERMSFKRW